jgi:hypothetical protein
MMRSDEELMNLARKQARDKIGFYIHFACYLVVNITLIIMWTVYYKVSDVMGLLAIVGGTLFGWGIGVVAHFFSVFGGPSEKRVQKEFKKLKNQ